MPEEELRLQNSSDLMYGNQDYDEAFPFDVKLRFKYLVYHVSMGYTEDGQPFPKLSTRRFTFITPTNWDTRYVPKDGMSFFEKQGKTYTILHDPIKQAELEGVKIKGYHMDKTGMSLQEKLRKAKPAIYVAKELQGVDENTVTYATDDFETPKKAGRPRKEVTND